MRSVYARMFAVICVLSTTGARLPTLVDDVAIADEENGENWLSYGRTSREQRYSPLDQINARNVKRLGVSWYLDLPQDRSLVSTPLVVDGVMYFVGSFNVVRAVEASSGELIWKYDPEVIATAGDRLRVLWDWNRGIAFWKGRVFLATIDGRLIALDATTGKEQWTTMTVDPKKALFITGAPKVFKDKVIIGNGGTEWGATRGYVTAYDTKTGEQVWRFYIVPGNPANGFESNAMAMAAKTWKGKWWEHGGGGNVWHGITYDPDFNYIYLGTGNGSPWNQKIRSPGGGDNLFLCSIVALDADTGKYRWHYQTTPGETWDYNSSMDIVLVDLPVGEKKVKALIHAPKNGFFYVLKRSNGQLLSAKPFAKVTWASGIDMKTGRPIERPGARYEDGEELVWPSAIGAHSWHAMSYNPDTGLAYIPTLDVPGLYNDKGVVAQAWRSPYFQFDPGIDTLREDAPASVGTGALKAWDPRAQTVKWEVPLPGIWNPGTMTTKGNLVFQGRADGHLNAYQADNGEILWDFDMGSGISAPPITYTVDGKQYVALLVGWGGTIASMTGALAAQHGWAYKAQQRRLVAFALDGQTELPQLAPPFFPQPIVASEFAIDEALAEKGSYLYARACAMCHGSGAVSGGYAPDLRASPIPLSDHAFHDVVIKGVRSKAGMGAFANLSPLDLRALQHFIRRQAHKQQTPAAQAGQP